MKPHKIAPYLAFLICKTLCAQILNKPFGTQNKLLGEISCVYAGQFATLNNPALLSSNQALQIGIFHEIPYLQKSIANSGISVQTEIRKFSYGMSFIQIGSEHFKQHIFSQGLAKKVSEQLYVGISLNYLITNQFGQDLLHNLYGSIGIKLQLNSKTLIGCHLINPSAAYYKIENSQAIGQYFQVGSAYKFSEQITFLAEYKTQVKSEGILSFGLLYQVKKELDFRMGFDKNLTFFSGGLRIQRKKMHWIIGTQFHRILGISPAAEWNYINL